MLLLLPVPVILATSLMVADAPKELQGEWTVVKVLEGDKEDPKAVGDVVTFKDNKIIIKPANRNETIEGTFKADAGKKPATIDFTMTGPNGQEQSALGLFELDGDSLKLCIAKANKERPAKIVPGDDVLIVTLKRKK